MPDYAVYNPPLHLIAFFYSQLTPWYCFSKRILRIKSTAFFVYGVLGGVHHVVIYVIPTCRLVTKILFSISRPKLQFITDTYTDRVMMAT